MDTHNYKIIQYQVSDGSYSAQNNKELLREVLGDRGEIKFATFQGVYLYEQSHDVIHLIQNGYCVMVMDGHTGIEIFSEKVMKLMLDDESFEQLKAGEIIHIEVKHEHS